MPYPKFPPVTLQQWQAAAEKTLRGKPLESPDLAHAGRPGGQAAVHGGGSGGAGIRRHAAGLRAVRARAAADHVRRAAVDHPPVRRLLDRRGIERLLPQGAGGRRPGRVGGLRSGHPPRLRLRPPARGRRRRQGRRGHRFGRGHENPVRRHSAGPGVGVDDHERRRAAGAGRLHRGRRGTGRRPGAAVRDHPERHPQGVHGPQHLHLPAGTVHAHRRRHHRLHRPAHAEVQLHLHFRLPHPGSRGHAGAGAGLHAGRRHGVRARRPGQRAGYRRLRAAAVVLLRHRHELLSGDRQAARRAPAVVADHESVRRQGPALADAAHALPDLRLVADRAGSVQQRHPHHHRGDGGGVRRHAEPAHQRARRGHRPADRVLGAHRPQHAAGDPGRNPHHQRDRPLGRLLPDGKAHPGHGRRGLEDHRGGRGARRHDQGHRDRHAQAAHRGMLGRPAGAHRPRRGHHRRRQQVPPGARRTPSTRWKWTTPRSATGRSRA